MEHALARIRSSHHLQKCLADLKRLDQSDQISSSSKIKPYPNPSQKTQSHPPPSLSPNLRLTSHHHAMAKSKNHTVLLSSLTGLMVESQPDAQGAQEWNQEGQDTSNSLVEGDWSEGILGSLEFGPLRVRCLVHDFGNLIFLYCLDVTLLLDCWMSWG